MKSMGIYNKYDSMRVSFDTEFYGGDMSKRRAMSKKESITSDLEMNIKRISAALVSVPRGNGFEGLEEWINQAIDLNENEKRVVFALASNLLFNENQVLPNDYLECNLKPKEKEPKTKYTERASSLLIEAFMSPNYRGFIKHLICNSISAYRMEASYSPEISESSGEISDSLTREPIKKGELYYDIVTNLGDHEFLKESSYNALKRADLLMRKVWSSSYFYTRKNAVERP